ncbi:hypothetical protein [Luteimonas sp. MHLX1A]|uniref:hypothetical protein n=1 Tax=Alterluteimonas muca TaxID=2878684 RepID=UPI001E4393BB|nr:hypothetical protein [Luteimonas sp. MHLX1A]MCD9046802.1 hypothetical protein [Luteimonas sp. MHLX1A]
MSAATAPTVCTTWQRASTAPPLNPPATTDFEAVSDPVLAIRTLRDGGRVQLVARYSRDLEESEESRWRSECSEAWTLHDVTHWRPLDWPEDT